MFQISRRFLLSSGLKALMATTFSFLWSSQNLKAANQTLPNEVPDAILTKRIQIQLPKVIADSRQIPIAISHTLPQANKLSIVIEKNPTPLLADFFISQTPWLRTNIKAAESCWLYVIIRDANNQSFYQKHWLTISENGCG